MCSRDGTRSPYPGYVVQLPNEARGSRSVNGSQRRQPQYSYACPDLPLASRATIRENERGNQSLVRIEPRGKVIYLEELLQPQGRRKSGHVLPVNLIKRGPRLVQDTSSSFSEEEMQQPRIIRLAAPRRPYQDQAPQPQIIRLARGTRSACSEGELTSQQPVVRAAPRRPSMQDEERTSPQMVRIIDPRDRFSVPRTPGATLPCEECVQEMMRSRSRNASRHW
ncbi:unnamed protein product [Ixodes pacificus]